jgi:hypothetical protein
LDCWIVLRKTLRYRIWTELAEAEQIVEDRGELPEGAPSHEAVAGLCLTGLVKSSWN